MPTYELKRKPSETYKTEFVYFFVVDNIYHLAATYKTDEEAKKWYDLCRKVFVQPINTKLHSRMHQGEELYLTQRQEVYVDPYNLEYYNKYTFYVMYGTYCVKSFTAYRPKEYDTKLAEATEYFNSYVHVMVKDMLAEIETIILEETN